MNSLGGAALVGAFIGFAIGALVELRAIRNHFEDMATTQHLIRVHLECNIGTPPRSNLCERKP